MDQKTPFEGESLIHVLWQEEPGVGDSSCTECPDITADSLVSGRHFTDTVVWYSNARCAVTGKTVALFILLVAIIAVALLVQWQKPDYYNPFTQFVFDCLMVIVTALLAFSFSANEAKALAEENTKRTWLPAAENACKQLITISITAQRMSEAQKLACESLQCFLPVKGSNNCSHLASALKLQCNQSSDRLCELRSHIENAIEEWRVFIRNNCRQGECEAIFGGLREWRRKQETTNYGSELQPGQEERALLVPSPEWRPDDQSGIALSPPI